MALSSRNRANVDTPGIEPAGPLAFYIHSVRSGLGAEKVVLNVISGLAGRGREIDLLIEDVEDDLRDRLPAGVNVVDVSAAARAQAGEVLFRVASALANLFRRAEADPCGRMSFRVALVRFLFKRHPPLYALRRYLFRRRPQAIISYLNYPNIALLLAAQLGKSDTRIYVNVRNNISGEVAGAKSKRMREMPVLMRNLFHLADGIVAVSEGVAADTERLMDLPAGRVTTIFNPVYRPEILALADAVVPHSWLEADALPVVLGVGKMKPQKDFSTLLKAFAQLRKERPARLVILGDGAGRKDLEALATDLGIRADVDFPGYVANPYVYFRHASVFVLSSAWEGLPNALIEAMACGCPVVSTDCPSGPSEILEGGRFGRLVPVGDAEAMARAIGETLDQPAASQAPKEHAQRFTFDRVVERYDRLLTCGSVADR
jgi:glycosyltransferase involved in cell wall biosynthesis